MVEMNGEAISFCQFRCSESLERKSLAGQSSEIFERARNPWESLNTELAEEDTRKRYLGIVVWVR